jgi:hypothetical protein
MFYRDAYNERVSYSHAENCEDWDFAKKIVLEGNIGLINQFGDFIYVHHGGNTMELSHHKRALDWNFKGDEETLIQNKDNIEDILNLLEEDFPISIASNTNEIIQNFYNDKIQTDKRSISLILEDKELAHINKNLFNIEIKNIRGN